MLKYLSKLLLYLSLLVLFIVAICLIPFPWFFLLAGDMAPKMSKDSL